MKDFLLQLFFQLMDFIFDLELWEFVLRCVCGWNVPHVSHPLPSPGVCRVIVGAPRANSTYSSSVHSPGAVFKCRVHSNPERRCTEMDLGRGQSLFSSCSINTREHNDIYNEYSSMATFIKTHMHKHRKVHYTHVHTGLSCSFSLSTLSINSPKHLFCFIRIMLPYSALNRAGVVLLVLNLLNG